MMGSGMGKGKYSQYCQFHRKGKNKDKDHPFQIIKSRKPF